MKDSLIKYKIEDITLVNEEEIKAVNNNKLLGLLQIELQQFNEDIWLIYNINGKNTLKEYLKNQLDIDKIYFILESLNSIFSRIANLIDVEKIILESNKIFVSEIDGEPRLYYIYLPINEEKKDYINQERFDQIVYKVLNKIENDDIRNRCSNYYNDKKLQDSLNILKEYIKPKQIKSNVFQENKIEKSIKQFNQETKKTFIKRFINIFKKEKKKTIFYEYNSDTVLLDGVNDTMVLKDNCKLLVYKSDGECIEEGIYLDNTMIGRDKSCNIIIDSKIISKNHAVILIEGERYYIKDVGSKNKTYINGKIIKPYKKMSLNLNDQLTFGNVKCKFVR